MAAIAQRAAVAPATFYLYFADAGEAVLALVERATLYPSELMALLTDPWPAGESQERSYKFVLAFSAHWQRNLGLLKAKWARSDEGDAEFAEIRTRSAMPMIHAFAGKILESWGGARTLPAREALAMASVLYTALERITASNLLGTFRNIRGVSKPEEINRALAVLIASRLEMQVSDRTD